MKNEKGLSGGKCGERNIVNCKNPFVFPILHLMNEIFVLMNVFILFKISVVDALSVK